MKKFADDNFKFDENGRKLSKWVENTVGKGEIARYEQFLLSPQCFQKACFPGASKGVIVWEWVNIYDRQEHTTLYFIDNPRESDTDEYKLLKRLKIQPKKIFVDGETSKRYRFKISCTFCAVWTRSVLLSTLFQTTKF